MYLYEKVSTSFLLPSFRRRLYFNQTDEAPVQPSDHFMITTHARGAIDKLLLKASLSHADCFKHYSNH
jgi:hypothetical protein